MKQFFFVLFSCFSFWACQSQTSEKQTQTPPVEMVLMPAPAFDADSAYEFIKRQVSFGARVPGTAAHQQCGDFLLNNLRRMGVEVVEQKFQARTFSGARPEARNVIGVYRPDLPKRILLAAHWDTRPFADQEKDKDLQGKPILGANDGASGVGVLLEVLRTIQADSSRLEVGVDIIFFDAEDYGQPEGTGQAQENTWCLGAQHWARNKHKPNYIAYFGILLDMVGAADAQFYKEATSMHYAPSVMEKVWATAKKAGYEAYFVNKQVQGVTDDHYYVNEWAKIPMIDIIQHDPTNQESFFGKYWHTHADNMDIIDKATLKAVGQTVLQVLYNEQKKSQ